MTDHDREYDLVRRYRKRLVEIEAVQLTDDADWSTVAQWCDSPLRWSHRKGDLKDQLPIRTLEGTMWASVGDWIIKDVKGEFYLYKPDIFEATYEPSPQRQVRTMTESSPIAETVAVVHKVIGWAAEGPISTCLGWHSHPVLGIEGHMHQGNEIPHTHRPVVVWDMEPSPIDRSGT